MGYNLKNCELPKPSHEEQEADLLYQICRFIPLQIFNFIQDCGSIESSLT